MAEINVGVQKTNDPQYTNFSQGTDRAQMQPLADVPNLSTKYVQPDWPTSKAAGTAIKDVGDIADSALRLTDAVIQKKASDTLDEGINRIRDSFGVAQAANNPKDAEAAGAAGGEGNDGTASLTSNDPNQPLALKKLGNNLQGLTEKYNQGYLTNSNYWARMEQFVRETKSQFPGYSDQIDQMVASKTGATPANALRGALQSDISELQRKVTALSDKRTAFIHQNAGVIEQAYPGFFNMAPDKRPSFEAIEDVVAKQAASDAKYDSRIKSMNLNKAQTDEDVGFAGRTLAEKGAEISHNSMLSMQNSLGIKTMADFQQYVDQVRAGTRKPPTVQEEMQLRALLGVAEQTVRQNYYKFANDTVKNGQSWSAIGGKTATDAGLAAAMTTVETLKSGLLDGNNGILASHMIATKALNETADYNVAKNPDMAITGAIKRQIGDVNVPNVLLNEKILTGASEAAKEQALQMLGQKKSVSEQIAMARKATDPDGKTGGDGEAIGQIVRQRANMVAHRDKLADPSIGDTAFQTTYGEGNDYLVANLGGNAKIPAFTDMYSPKVTAAVQKRSMADQQTYYNSAIGNFESAFELEARRVDALANGLNATGSKNLQLKFNPKEMSFEYDGSAANKYIANHGLPIPGAPPGIGALNAGLQTLKPIFQMAGREPSRTLYNMLNVMGIEPNSVVYKAVQKAYDEEKGAEAPSGVTP